MPVTIPALPTPVPQSTDPVNFDARADATLGWLPGGVDAMNAQNAENNALNLAINATAAAASAAANAALEAAASAATSAGAQPFVSGAVYAKDAAVLSPVTGRTYRRKTAGAGALDPSVDTENWTPLTLDLATGLPKSRPSIRLSPASSRTVDPRFVFTRASAGTCIGPNGDMLTVAANRPRFDHDPATGECLGLLIEMPRTNVLLNSATLSTQSVTVTDQAYTLSFYGSGSITLSGATDLLVQGTGAYPARTVVTFTPLVGTLTLTVSGTVQYANLEAGAFATSWVPTTGAAATRNEDLLSFSGADFAKAYRAGVGTLLSHIQVIGYGASAQAVSLNDNTTGNYVRPHTLVTTNVRAQVLAGGVPQAQINLQGAAAPGQVLCAVVSYRQDNVLMCLNGGTVVQDTSATIPVMDRLTVNSANAAYRVRDLMYFPQALTAGEIQALSAIN